MEGRSRRVRADWAIAVVLALAMAAAAALTGAGRPAVRAGTVLASAALLALAVRRRYPLRALAAVLAVILIEASTGRPGVAAPSFLALMAATYSVGAHASARAAAVGLPAAVAGMAVAQLLSPPSNYSHADAIAFFAVILVIAPAAAGAVIRVRSSLAGRLRQATRRLQDARAHRTASAVARERERIAAELEVVMLRGLDGMRRHAGALDREEVAQLERLARDTLAGMRGLVARFRTGDGTGPDPADDRTPARSMAELRSQVTAALTAEPAAAVPDTRAPAALAPARWVLPAPWQVDTALTVAALGLAVVLAATRRWPGDALLAVAIVLPFAWLRRRPLSAAAVSLAATVAYSAVARPADPLAGLPPVSVLIVVPLLAGAVCAVPQAIGALLACLAAAALAVVTDPPPDFASGSVPVAAALALACWAAGRALRDGSRLLSALAETAAQVRDEDAAAARQAVAEERLRIARELHDAVGHALTTVVMQATAARRVWDSDPALARGHVTTLRVTVAQTVSELHGFVLSAVVGGGDVSAGLAGIPALVTRASACGLTVHLQATGTERRIPSAVGQTAYRIVQEAVTNAARHAPGAAVQVTVTWDAAGLLLEIMNEQPAWPPGPAGPAAGPAEPAPGRAGHGLLGMRERAAGCGGTVTAGPRPGGGFTVQAQLPCPGSVAAGDAG